MRPISSTTTYVPYENRMEWCVMFQNVPARIKSPHSEPLFDTGSLCMSGQSCYTSVVIWIAWKLLSSKLKMNSTNICKPNTNCLLRKLGHWQQHDQPGRRPTHNSLTPEETSHLSVCPHQQKWLGRLTGYVDTSRSGLCLISRAKDV